jgi:cation diffusion facilitator family transporter
MNVDETPDTTQPAKQRIWRWALFSLAVSISLTAGKTFAWWITGSAAILSDALESIVNILSSSFVIYAIWLANKPRDADHPYGHGKVEFFSAGFEGALVLFAALAILGVGVVRLFDPQLPESMGLGAALQATISVVTLLLGQLIIAAGKRHSSPSLVADGIHIRSDAVTSFGVLIGLLGVMFTGWAWLDPLCAVLVGVWLATSGVRVIREAVAGLMDEADPALLGEIAAELQRVRKPGWIGPHHAKIHRLGRSFHLDLHMVFPRYWPLEQAHDASEEIEAALRERFGAEAELMLHMESCTPRSCSYCDVADCPVRTSPLTERPVWDAAHIATPHRH